MKAFLEQQCNRIEAVFASHRIPARVTGGTVTPRWIRYDVLPALGTRIGAITGLAEELAAALGAPSVRVVRQGAVIAVEVPRENPRPVRLLPLLQGLRNVPPATAILGIADNGSPLLLRLPSPDVRNVLVSGPVGCGKSALLRAMVISLAYFTPGLKVAVNPDPLSLARLVKIRCDWRETWPPVVALYDGLPVNLDGLGEVLRDGWRWEVYVILATRHPAALGGLVTLFPVRVEGTGTPGDFCVQSGDWTGRFWAAWPDVEATLRLPAGR